MHVHMRTARLCMAEEYTAERVRQASSTKIWRWRC